MADAWQVTNVCNWPKAEWLLPGVQHRKADIAPGWRFSCYRPIACFKSTKKLARKRPFAGGFELIIYACDFKPFAAIC